MFSADNMNTSNDQNADKSAYERVFNISPPHKKISMGQQGVPITIKFQINRDGVLSKPITGATTIVYPDQSFNTMNMVVENHETVEADDSRSISSSDEEEHDTSQLVRISLEQETIFHGQPDGGSTDVILLQESVGLKEK